MGYIYNKLTNINKVLPSLNDWFLAILVVSIQLNHCLARNYYLWLNLLEQ